MLNSKQEAAIAAKLEEERLARVERKRREEAAAFNRSGLTGGALADAMAADYHAAKDGFNPKA